MDLTKISSFSRKNGSLLLLLIGLVAQCVVFSSAAHAESNSFRSERYGFTLTYPDSLTQTFYPNPSVVLVLAPKQPPAVNINIVALAGELRSEEMTPEAQGRALQQSYRELGLTAALVTSRRCFTQSSRTACSFEIVDQPLQPTVRYRVTVYSGDSEHLVYTCTGDAHLPESAFMLCDEVGNSITFLAGVPNSAHRTFPSHWIWGASILVGALGAGVWRAYRRR